MYHSEKHRLLIVFFKKSRALTFLLVFNDELHWKAADLAMLATFGKLELCDQITIDLML